MKKQFNLLPMTTYRWTKANYTELDVAAHVDASQLTAVWSQPKQVECVTGITTASLTFLRPQFRGADPETFAETMSDAAQQFKIVVPEDTKQQLRLNLTFTETQNHWLGAVIIDVQANAELALEIVIDNESKNEGRLNYAILSSVGDNAVLKITKVHTGVPLTTAIEHRYTRLNTASQAAFIGAEFGAERIIYHSDADLLGEASTLSEEGVYVANEKQHLDLYYDRNHFGKKTESHLATYGALRDAAKKVFRGCIDFKHGSSGAIGNEEDYVVLLSPQAKNISLPLLLCTEDDVQGNHASSAGQMDKERLYYLMSRGFSQEEAKRLVVEAMLRPVIDKIIADDLREAVLTAVETKMEAI